jgi:hypothetical protein
MLITNYKKRHREISFFSFDFETYKEVYFDRDQKTETHFVYAVSLVSSKENLVWVKDNEAIVINEEYKKVVQLVSDPIRSFLDYILLNYKGFTGYAHNMANFDGYLLMNKVTNEDINHNDPVIFTSNQLYSLNLEGIKIKDSRKLVGFSLDMLGKSFNLELKKTVFDIVSITKNNYVHKINDIIPYCINDSEVLYEFLGKFSAICKSFSSVNPLDCVTLPQFAYRTFLADYYDPDITPIYKIANKSTYKFLRKGYYGGRVDYTDLKHRSPLYLYDVNSMYPAMMRNTLPIGRGRFLNESELSNIDIKSFFGFVEVRVNTSETNFPILPKRHKEGGLAFPNGIIEGVYFSEELRYALENGYELLEIKRACEFDKGEGLFDSYVNSFNKIKEEASEQIRDGVIIREKNLPLYTMGKLMSNALYGKTAQRPITEKAFITDNLSVLENLIDSLPLDNEFKIAFVEKDNDLIEFYPVNIAAAITAYSRVLLHSTVTQVGIKNVVYCDTDSIVTLKELPKDLINNKRLGMWKLEGIFDKGGNIYDAKCYHLFHKDQKKDKIVGKGAKKDNREVSLKYFREEYEKVECPSRIAPISLIEKRDFGKDKQNWSINYTSILKRYKPLAGKKRKHVPKTFHTVPLRCPEDF